MSTSKKASTSRWAIPPKKDPLEVSSGDLDALATQLPTASRTVPSVGSVRQSCFDTVNAPAHFDEEESPSSSGFQTKGTYAQGKAHQSSSPLTPSAWTNSLSEPFDEPVLRAQLESDEPPTEIAEQLREYSGSEALASEVFSYEDGLKALARAGRHRAVKDCLNRESMTDLNQSNQPKVAGKTDISELNPDSIVPPAKPNSEPAAPIVRSSETLPAPAKDFTSLEIEVTLSKIVNKV